MSVGDWVFVAIVVAVAAFASGQSRWGWFLALTVGLPYAGVQQGGCGHDGGVDLLGGGRVVGLVREQEVDVRGDGRGGFGVIYEVTLKVRPVSPFAVSHRRCSIEQFSAAAEKLCRTDVGIKFYLLPFRDRVYLDLRRYSPDATSAHRIPWRVKDWGESTVLPQVFKSLNRIVPVAGVRYRLIDEISGLTQGIVNNRLVSSGSNATAVGGGSGTGPLSVQYSTWVFPAADFSIVVQAYTDFCMRMQKESGFRCDMPTMGFRLCRDQSALLSPSFDEPMFALRAMSTQARGWEDFVIDLAEFARHWGGIPLFDQTRSVTPDYTGQVFGSRLDFFRRIRRRLDPDNRLMNPFLSQYFL